MDLITQLPGFRDGGKDGEKITEVKQRDHTHCAANMVPSAPELSFPYLPFVCLREPLEDFRAEQY